MAFFWNSGQRLPRGRHFDARVRQRFFVARAASIKNSRCILSLVLSLTTIWFQYNRAINVMVVNANNFPTRLAVAGWDVWFYFYKLLFPKTLIFVYPRWAIDWKNFIVYMPGIAVFVVLAA